MVVCSARVATVNYVGVARRIFNNNNNKKLDCKSAQTAVSGRVCIIYRNIIVGGRTTVAVAMICCGVCTFRSKAAETTRPPSHCFPDAFSHGNYTVLHESFTSGPYNIIIYTHRTNENVFISIATRPKNLTNENKNMIIQSDPNRS